MNVFAKFDEIPSMILKVIKETKRYGHTVGRSENGGGGGGGGGGSGGGGGGGGGGYNNLCYFLVVNIL